MTTGKTIALPRWTFVGKVMSLLFNMQMTQMVKCLPTMGETWIRSLGGEDPLEKEMATYSSTLAGGIPWTEEPGGLQSMGCSRQEYWSRLPFPSPGDLPNPQIEPGSPTL